MTAGDRNPDGGAYDVPLSSPGAAPQGPSHSPAKGPTIRILTIADLSQEPSTEYLVEGVLAVDSLALLHSPPGVGKTFFALSLAVALASGGDWCGRKVREGYVFFIAAEGARGINQRVHALLGDRIKKADDPVFERFRIIPHAVNLFESVEVDELIKSIRAITKKVAAIVVDTLPRCMSGADENTAQDMGKVIASCDRLRLATGATILLLHHPAKRGEDERGSSALGGAVDTRMKITLKDGLRVLECTKQKDDAAFEPVYFRLKPVPVDMGDRVVTSCVVELCESSTASSMDPGSPPPSAAEEVEPPNPQDMIRWKLRENFGPEGAQGSELLAAAGLDDATFYRHLGHMRKTGEVVIVGTLKPVRYGLAERSGSQSHSHSHPAPGPAESESGQSQSQSRAPVGGETESESGTGPERDLYGDSEGEDYHP